MPYRSSDPAQCAEYRSITGRNRAEGTRSNMLSSSPYVLRGRGAPKQRIGIKSICVGCLANGRAV